MCIRDSATAYGAHGHSLERVEDFIPLVEKCLAAGGVHLVNVPVDYSENDRILNQELPILSAKV